MAESRREVLEKAARAYVAYLRAYKEHQCSYIFRTQVCSKSGDEGVWVRDRANSISVSIKTSASIVALNEQSLQTIVWYQAYTVVRSHWFARKAW